MLPGTMGPNPPRKSRRQLPDAMVGGRTPCGCAAPGCALNRPARLSLPSRRTRAHADAIGAPLVWSFDGAFATCLADAEDPVRRPLLPARDPAPRAARG